MTAASIGVGFSARLARLKARLPDSTTTTVPLSPALALTRAVLVALAVVTMSLVVELVLVSPFQQRAAQQAAYDRFRAELALGTAPVAAGDLADKKGDPVAYLEIPSISLRQVVFEGSDASTLFSGPGHRRDTPLPGQAGTSVVLGRRAAFGAPFDSIDSLRKNAVVRVTTGAGVFDYRVLGVRRSGDAAPAARRSGAGRIALVTADGTPFVPSGLVIVDADLIVPGLGGAGPSISPRSLPESERLLAVDLSTLWRLVLWLQLLLVVVLGGVFAWLRWDRAKTWIVFVPTLLLVGLLTAGEAARLLPNLL